jgi:hypothetical protein
MNELYELKEKLCRELKKYNNEEVTTNSLEVVDKLSHAIKNIDKIIDKYEEDEGGSYGYDPSYRMSNRGGRSYNNGSYSRGRGRNAKRDSMGRYASDGGYSRHGDMVEQLREMMMEAPSDDIRRDYERVISRIESM